MRITMICIGSTGDVRPYIILGRELKSRGHDVAICAFSPFEQTILSEGMRYKRLRGDVKELMAGLMTGASGVMFLKQARDALRYTVRTRQAIGKVSRMPCTHLQILQGGIVAARTPQIARLKLHVHHVQTLPLNFGDTMHLMRGKDEHVSCLNWVSGFLGMIGTTATLA